MFINRKLLDTFLDIHRNGRSGVLRFEKGREKKQLVLRRGRVAFAESNVPEEHLARILVRLELLPRAKVNEVASLMKTGKTSEEAILALSGPGTRDLEKGRREQAIVVLASLWALDSCEMRWFDGEGLVQCRVDLGLSMPEAMVLAARRAVSGRLVQIPQDFTQRIFRMAEDGVAKAMDLPLSSSESYVYSLLQQPVHASEVLALLPATGAKPEEILVCLFLLGMVEVEQSADGNVESCVQAEPSSAVQQLEAMLELGCGGRERPTVVKTIATKGDGVEALAAEIRRLLRSRPPSDREARRKRRLAWMLRDIVKESLSGLLAGRIPEAEFDRCVDGIYRRDLDPYTAADRLLGRLRKEPPAGRRRR